MTYVSKPGDILAAKAIGTYPELPDTLDTPDRDPHWWRTDEFRADGGHVMRFGGPDGTVAVELHEGVHTIYSGDVGGPVLSRVRWDHVTSTWIEEAR